MTNTLQLIRKLALNNERITTHAKKKAFSSKSNEVQDFSSRARRDHDIQAQSRVEISKFWTTWQYYTTMGYQPR